MSSADHTAAPLPQLPARQPESHKGDYGRVLLIGGSPAMCGAIALAGRAALRSGAGLVTLAVPKAVHATVAGFDPCLMTLGLACDAGGHLSEDCLRELAGRPASQADVWAIGPGLGRTPGIDALAERIYCDARLPLVVDADALYALANRPYALARPGGPRVLTPHPGEFARLAAALDANESIIEAARSTDRDRRMSAAVWLAACDPSSATVVVLKGHRTVIAGRPGAAVNQTGNAGMATGGSGDVLSGVIAALLGQGLKPFDAARLGVHLHGVAGDLAASRVGQVSLIASDLIDSLPAAFLKHAAESGA